MKQDTTIRYAPILILAWLPLWALYLVADLLAPLLYHVVRYRRKVTDTNLRKAFPERSDKERRSIARHYYRHLADLLAEAVFNLRTTPTQIKRRYHITNREIIDRYYERGQSVVLVSAHYNNWEYMVAGLNMLFLHHGIGVGKPLSNKGFGWWLTQRRTRYGTEVVDQCNVREVMDYYHRHHVPCAYMMLCDQSPNDVHKCYWTTFLHQETGFIYGPEYFARKYNYPVLFYEVRKTCRGHYELTFSELCSRPDQTEQYDITRRYIRRLDAVVQREPAYWLWSHKRWKRIRPAEIPLHAAVVPQADATHNDNNTPYISSPQ